MFQPLQRVCTDFVRYVFLAAKVNQKCILKVYLDFTDSGCKEPKVHGSTFIIFRSDLVDKIDS